MSNTVRISNCLLLALLLTSSISSLEAGATKLSAQPLPHESDLSQRTPQQIVPAVSRFYKGNDVRDEQARNEQAEAKAAKQAEIDRKRAIEENAIAIKQHMQASVDANNKAVQLGKQGRWAEAMQEHERAIQLDPTNKQYRINLSAARTAYGEQRLAQHDLHSACHLFRQALAIAPDNAQAGRRLVEAIRKMGVDPSSADVRIGFGDQLVASNDLEGAAVEYQAAMQLEDSARCCVKMGDMAYRYGQIAGACAWYKQATIKNADYGPAYRQLGFIALSQKDLTSAAAYLRKAVILDSKDSAAAESLVDLWRKQVASSPAAAENHLGLAGALQLAGDFPGADSEYRKLEMIDPRNSGLQSGRASLARAFQHAQAERHKLAADTLYGQNLRKEALAEISQAVMMEPRNAHYQFLLGECLEANGDYQGAHQAYLTCVLIDPENNKEAAARMKQMQASGNNNVVYHNSSAPAQAPAGLQMANQQTALTPTAMTPANHPASQLPSKDQFEGGNGIPSIANTQLGFRTHDESPVADSSLAKAADNVASRSSMNTANSPLQQVNQAEMQRDYEGASNLLRQILPNNLQNPELHHRLAVNLMSAGEISEAISEFRIASALCPNKRDYSDDLARALAIHKRSLMSSSTNVEAQAKPLASPPLGTEAASK